jgi:hypothetical protein
MTITLDMSAQQEQIIRRKAAVANMTLEQYLLSLAIGLDEKRERRSKRTQPHSTWGAQVLAELDAEGVLEGYGDPGLDSTEVAAQLRERFSRSQSR